MKSELLKKALIEPGWTSWALDSIYNHQISGETITWFYDEFEAFPYYFNEVKKIIQYTDDIIDLDFSFTKNRLEADLLFRVDDFYSSNNDEANLGLFTDNTEWGLAQIFVHPEETNQSNINTAVHEFGHYLGLGEPGYDNRFDQFDTAMSYNINNSLKGGYQTYFTQNDLNVLLHLHGSEDDQLSNSLVNLIKGSNGKDKLIGSDGVDKIIGKRGSDKIFAKGGDDLIDPGVWNSGRFDKITGGKGSDTFVIKDGYWALIKDFNIVEDKLDISGLRQGLDWQTQAKKTYIFGSDGYEVVRLKGRLNLSDATLI